MLTEFKMIVARFNAPATGWAKVAFVFWMSALGVFVGLASASSTARENYRQLESQIVLIQDALETQKQAFGSHQAENNQSALLIHS